MKSKQECPSKPKRSTENTHWWSPYSYNDGTKFCTFWTKDATYILIHPIFCSLYLHAHSLDLDISYFVHTSSLSLASAVWMESLSSEQSERSSEKTSRLLPYPFFLIDSIFGIISVYSNPMKNLLFWYHYFFIPRSNSGVCRWISFGSLIAYLEN